jgi:hypothetical protein
MDVIFLNVDSQVELGFFGKKPRTPERVVAAKELLLSWAYYEGHTNRRSYNLRLPELILTLEIKIG